jgi:hypothetical protein
MAIIGNISEIAMKDQESINNQIQIAENELAGLDAKRAALQDRIRQLKGLKQSIADEQLPFGKGPLHPRGHKPIPSAQVPLW